MSYRNCLADVNVISKGRYSNREYTYIVPLKLSKKIRPNDLVIIQFNNREVNGVVRKVYHGELLHDIKYLEVKKILFNVEKNLLEYIENLSNFYINPLGHTIHYHFRNILDQKCLNESKQNSSSKYIFKIDARKELCENISNSILNVIYCPSIKSIDNLNKYLNDQGILVNFKQSSGGATEQRMLYEYISNNTKGIVIALSSSIFNPHMDSTRMNKHYWDINHYKYNESRKPNFSLIDVSNIQNKYTKHIHFYYSEFPNYKYVTEHKDIYFDEPKLNIKYFYGDTVLEAIDVFSSHEDINLIDNLTYNFNFCSTELSNKIINKLTTNKELTLYSEGSKISKYHVLIEPTISHNRLLNSDSLSALIRYLNILQNNNSKLFVLTKNNKEILSLLKQNTINKWLKTEFEYRDIYGPNHRLKVIEILSKKPIEELNLNLIGPIKTTDNEEYKYQFMYSSDDSSKTNYFEKLKKYNYSFIKYF